LACDVIGSWKGDRYRNVEWKAATTISTKENGQLNASGKNLEITENDVTIYEYQLKPIPDELYRKCISLLK
jgi:hypothetical protein